MAFQFNVNDYRSHQDAGGKQGNSRDNAAKQVFFIAVTFAFGLAIGDLMRPNSYLGETVLPQANQLVASLAHKSGTRW